MKRCGADDWKCSAFEIERNKIARNKKVRLILEKRTLTVLPTSKIIACEGLKPLRQARR